MQSDRSGQEGGLFSRVVIWIKLFSMGGWLEGRQDGEEGDEESISWYGPLRGAVLA